MELFIFLTEICAVRQKYCIKEYCKRNYAKIKNAFLVLRFTMLYFPFHSRHQLIRFLLHLKEKCISAAQLGYIAFHSSFV